MSRKLFLWRSQIDAEVQEVMQVDEVSTDRITEQTPLRSAPHATENQLIEQLHYLQFVNVSTMSEHIFSERDEIGLVVANNNATTVSGSQRYSRTRDERNDGKIDEISSNYDLQHELPGGSRSKCEMQSESSQSAPNQQIRVDQKRKNVAGASNVSESETPHTIEVQQCNQRNNSRKSDAEIVVDNHQMEGVLQLKKRQAHLTGESSEASLRNTPQDRKQTKTHSCASCGREFKWNCQLIVHIRTHTGEKPYKCEECGHAFTRSGDFKRHQKTHTVEKPLFKCQSCPDTFRLETAFNSHLSMHENNRWHKCNICNRSYKQKNHLADHMSIHNDEKLHKCNVCEITFRYSTQLYEHRRNHRQS